MTTLTRTHSRRFIGRSGNALPALPAGLLLFALLASIAHATLADKAFEKLRQSPPEYPDRFEFVVIGDTRADEPIVLPDAFRQCIREWNVLNPAFVIDSGDLVLGGAAEGLDPQWTEFERTVSESNPPFFPVAGNHDISDPVTEAIYTGRIGPLVYGFSYGNSRFIALNSEEQGAIDRLTDAQVAWLRADLANTTAENIFLFLHRPYFAGDWDRQWRNVAEAIKGYPVRAVFGSHWHLYRDCGERDGVRYVVTGGGGAGVSTPEEEGGFFHYLYVQVRGDDVQWAVVKPGAILAENTVTAERIAEIRAFQNAFRTGPLNALYGEPFDREVRVVVENPYERPFISRITWTVPEGWEVTPREARLEATPNLPISVPFHIQAAGPESVRFPVPEYSVVVDIAEYGDPVKVTKRIDLVPTTYVPHAAQPVSIDGDLSDWADTEALPMIYPYDFDIADTADLHSQVRLMWDEANLYLAVETVDDEFYQPYAGDIVWSADNVQLFLERYEWGLTLTEKGEEVFLYKGPERDGETVNTAVKLAVRRDGVHSVYEAAFPAHELRPLLLEEGASYSFSIVMNDLDPSVAGRTRHWVELTPGAGAGGDNYPRVQLILDNPEP